MAHFFKKKVSKSKIKVSFHTIVTYLIAVRKAGTTSIPIKTFPITTFAITTFAIRRQFLYLWATSLFSIYGNCHYVNCRYGELT